MQFKKRFSTSKKLQLKKIRSLTKKKWRTQPGSDEGACCTDEDAPQEHLQINSVLNSRCLSIIDIYQFNLKFQMFINPVARILDVQKSGGYQDVRASSDQSCKPPLPLDVPCPRSLQITRFEEKKNASSNLKGYLRAWEYYTWLLSPTEVFLS